MKRQVASRCDDPARGQDAVREEVRTVSSTSSNVFAGNWPKVDILVRGDSHYGRDEAMEWCEETPCVDYVFGFAATTSFMR